MKQKGLAPIVIIILVAVALGMSGYLIYSKQAKPTTPLQRVTKATPAVSTLPAESSSSAETSNWKAYINGKMKFSLKIPPLWFSHPENKVLSGYSAVFSYPIDNPTLQNWRDQQRASVEIAIFQNNSKSIYQQAQERIESDQRTKKKIGGHYPEELIEQPQRIKVDGEEGLVLYSKDGYYEMILINHGNLTYLITLGTPKPIVQIEEILPTFNQILSTFKFLP